MKKVTYIFTLHIIQGIYEENKWVNIKKVLSLKFPVFCFAKSSPLYKGAFIML